MSTAHKAPDAAQRARRAPRKKRSITIPPRLREAEAGKKLDKHWRTYFLAALIETSNVTRAAEAAGISASRAYRVLTLHRQTVAHQRAQDDDMSEQDVLESINAMIDEMRDRASANAALLAAPESGDARD